MELVTESTKVKQAKKIRHKNWYWGKFIYSGQILDGTKFTDKSEDFELYDEDLHGYKNSEEYKKYVNSEVK